jgi:hypothetical protein
MYRRGMSPLGMINLTPSKEAQSDLLPDLARSLPDAEGTRSHLFLVAVEISIVDCRGTVGVGRPLGHCIRIVSTGEWRVIR